MKCKDKAHEWKVTPMQIGRLRKQLFPKSEGGDLTDEEAAAIDAYFEELEELDTRKELEEAVKPQFVDAICSYAKEGRREVECKIRGENGRIETVYALIPTSSHPERLLGKPMKLEFIEYNDKKYYRHASLTNYAWPKGYGSDK